MEEDRSYGHVLDKSALYIHHALCTALQAGPGRDSSRPYEGLSSARTEGLFPSLVYLTDPI